MPKFSKKSQEKIDTMHEDLQDILNVVIKHRDIVVLEGHRDPAAQQKAFDEGKSKARPGQSPHNCLPSMAFDIAPFPIPDWNSKDPKVQAAVALEFRELAIFVKGVAAGLGVDITWGGDFKSFFDGPHFELTNWVDLKRKG